MAEYNSQCPRGIDRMKTTDVLEQLIPTPKHHSNAAVPLNAVRCSFLPPSLAKADNPQRTRAHTHTNHVLTELHVCIEFRAPARTTQREQVQSMTGLTLLPLHHKSAVAAMHFSSSCTAITHLLLSSTALTDGSVAAMALCLRDMPWVQVPSPPPLPVLLMPQRMQSHQLA